MDYTFSTSLPSSSASHVETMTDDILQDNIVKIHEDLANVKTPLGDEDMSYLVVPIIDSLHCMIEDIHGWNRSYI
jgi:hypothetical protein